MAKAQDKDKDERPDDEKPQPPARDTAPAANYATADDIASLRERVARLEGLTPDARPGDPPTGPKYVVQYPNWSDKPAGSTVRESQLGGSANAARLVGLGQVTPYIEPETEPATHEGDAPAA